MSFVEAIKHCFSNYATFSGRAPRSEYWWFTLFVLILNIVAAVVDTALFASPDGFGIFSVVFTLAVLLPSIAVVVRRLHDIGRTGWWWWMFFIPLIGAIVLIVFFVTAGTEGDNEHGPNPLSARATA